MRLLHHKAHGLQHLGQHRGGVGVVVHHQHTAPAHIRRRQQHARRGTTRQRHGEPEGRALAHLAGYAHAAPHEFSQALADGQAQPRAAVFAGGRGIGLLKTLEQLRHLFGGEAYAGITNFKAQHHLRRVLFLHPHGDADLAMLGELDGVVGVVDQNLPQAQRVAHQIGGHVRGHIANQLQPLGRCLVADHIHHPGQHLVQRERLQINVQLARLDAGDVEDVVDHAHQVATSLVDLADVVVLALRQPRLQRQMGHANDGVHRRANLVAHVGQKVGLEHGGFFRQLFGAAQGLLGALAVGDVHQHTNHAAQAAIGAVKALQPVQRVVYLAIGIRHGHFAVYGRAPSVQGGLHIGLELHTLHFRQLGALQHGLTQQIPGLQAKHLCIGPVKAQVAALGIFVEHRHGNGVDQHLLEQHLGGHTLLQLFLFLDVHIHAHHALGHAIGVAENAGRTQKPAHPALRALHAPGVAEVGLLACQRSIHACQCAGAVFGGQTAQPGGAPVVKHALTDAVFAGQLLRPDGARAAQVNIEDTDLARLLGQLQAFTGLAHGHLDAPGFGDIVDHPDRGAAATLNVYAAPGQACLKTAAVLALQCPVQAHWLVTGQQRLYLRRERSMLLQTAKEHAGALPRCLH